MPLPLAPGQHLTPQAMLALFDEMGIAHQLHEHEAVFTTAESAHLHETMPGAHCKSLFLKDKKGALKLLVCAEHWRVDLKRFAQLADFGRPSFGKPDLLEDVLGVTPGSVTPFALAHDTQGQVEVWLDHWMLAQGLVNYHPLINTMTCTLSSADLVRFLIATGHAPRVVDLDDYTEHDLAATLHAAKTASLAEG